MHARASVREYRPESKCERVSGWVAALLAGWISVCLCVCVCVLLCIR